MQYHQSDWSPAPEHIKHQGAGRVLDNSQDSPNVIAVAGQQFGKLTLLVVPPHTDATHAYNVVMTATSAPDSSTPDQLLGSGIPGATDRPHALSRCNDGSLTEELCILHRNHGHICKLPEQLARNESD